MSDKTNLTNKPRLWKILVIAWFYGYLLVNIIFAVIGEYIKELNPLTKNAILTTLLTPAMVLGIPAFQKWFYNWIIK